jgi:uncharacterized alpha-E superfamily protein
MEDEHSRLYLNINDSFNVEEDTNLLEAIAKFEHITTELMEEFRNKTKKLEDITDSLHKISVELKASIKPITHEIVKNVKQELIQDLDDKMKDCQNNIAKTYNIHKSVIDKTNTSRPSLLRNFIIISIVLSICISYYTVARKEQNDRAAEAIEIEKDYRYER